MPEAPLAAPTIRMCRLGRLIRLKRPVETSVGKGYAEGPVAEEAEARLDELERGLVEEDKQEERLGVYGSTANEAAPHFLGWLGEVDPDDLFATGRAWGITVRRRAAGS